MSHTQRIMRKGIAVFWLGVSPLSSAFADVSLGGNNWVDSLKFGGNLRLRHDTLQEMGGPTDRNRERFRLRFGLVATIQDFMVKFQMASGTGSQFSANQTETGDFNQKSLWIDQAYLAWKAQEHITLQGGRMANPFWLVYASDSMWDPDLNPEGYAQKFDLPMGDRLGLFANAGQFVTTDAFTSGGAATSDKNVWIFGEQIGAKTTLFEETKWTLALANYAFINERLNPTVAAPGVTNPGNSISAAGVLLTPFNILEFTNEFAFHAGPVPLSLQAEYVTNTQYQRGAGTAVLSGGRTGYQVGAIAGKASAAHTWEGAYFYKYLEQNASVANLADDDFGNGGTNRAGHIFWVAYAPRDYVQLKLKYYITRVLDQTLTTAGAAFTGQNGDTNRLFLDVMLKF